MTAPVVDLVPLLGPLPLGAIVSGPRFLMGDPTWHLGEGVLWRATWTAEGAATVCFERASDGVRVSAWGPGAATAVGEAPAWLGVHDDPSGFEPGHPVVARLAKRFPGLRIGRTERVWEVLAPAVLAQKVPGAHASRSWKDLVYGFSERAPGPDGLWMPPRADRIAGLRYFDLHRCGVEQRRAETLLRAAREAPRLERVVRGTPAQATERLTAVRGIGPWTAAKVVGEALGDPDAVPLGDYNLPHAVAWALAGERRADDARMLELLEPWRGHRARVLRLLHLGHVRPPRRGPRMEVVDFRDR